MHKLLCAAAAAFVLLTLPGGKAGAAAFCAYSGGDVGGEDCSYNNVGAVPRDHQRPRRLLHAQSARSGSMARPIYDSVRHSGRQEIAMNADGADGHSSPEDGTSSMGAGSWILLTVLLCILAGTGVFILFGWQLGGDLSLPEWGYVALGIGVVLSLAVGIGLMALLFYSSRKGYDQSPAVIFPEAEPDESKAHRKAD